jgi:hypothetical protein
MIARHGAEQRSMANTALAELRFVRPECGDDLRAVHSPSIAENDQSFEDSLRQ